MRGKEELGYYDGDTWRITPAYAGKRYGQSDCRRLCLDHPRLCGEKLSRIPAKVSEMGSPPPMRGKEKKQTAGISLIRITPAYAGKSRPTAINGVVG